MHLDNKRLVNIQQYKALIHRKLKNETDKEAIQLWQQKLEYYTQQEKQILKDLDVKI